MQYTKPACRVYRVRTVKMIAETTVDVTFNTGVDDGYNDKERVDYYVKPNTIEW